MHPFSRPASTWFVHYNLNNSYIYTSMTMNESFHSKKRHKKEAYMYRTPCLRKRGNARNNTWSGDLLTHLNLFH